MGVLSQIYNLFQVYTSQHYKSWSGIPINNECLKGFQKLKVDKTLSYIIFKMNTSYTEIIVENTGTSRDFDYFYSELPETESRFAVYDANNKLVFVTWMPDAAKTKDKMIFISSKDALKGSLDGIAVEVQGGDLADIVGALT
ncbi:unnamed protein product [Penicillium nalgiovense]|nr:unnamed protein product [Penicillium nalgiovense]